MMESVTSVGWLVLLLVFVDELLCLVAFGMWGWQQDPASLWVWLLPLAGALAWFTFASPKARLGGAVVRPLVKLVVFGLATAALWDLGHATGAVAFLVFSIAVNALATIPSIAALADESTGRSQSPPA